MASFDQLRERQYLQEARYEAWVDDRRAAAAPEIGHRALDLTSQEMSRTVLAAGTLGFGDPEAASYQPEMDPSRPETDTPEPYTKARRTLGKASLEAEIITMREQDSQRTLDISRLNQATVAAPTGYELN